MVIPATLTGQAVGDALGMPFETQHFSSARLMQWDGSFQASGYHNLKPGQWTDDTQMAVALAESLSACKGYDQDDAARRYLALFTSGTIRGYGSTTKTAMDNLLRGDPAPRSGVIGAEGNGTAMRVAPLGLYLSQDMNKVVLAAKQDANITHTSVEARQGSVAVAVGVALLRRGETRQGLVGRVLPWLDSSQVRTRLQQVEHRLMQGGVTVRDLIEMGTGAHVIETVPAAFLAFGGTGTFKDAVEMAVQAGGDTDTTAAITGALAGTLYGTEQVDPYLAELEDGARLRGLEAQLAAGPV